MHFGMERRRDRSPDRDPVQARSKASSRKRNAFSLRFRPNHPIGLFSERAIDHVVLPQARPCVPQPEPH